jgi:predicted nucleotidyltransferase
MMKTLSPEEGMLGALAFAESLNKAMGDRLVMSALYGSIVKGGFRRESSDVNLLVVLSMMDMETHKILSSPLQNAREDFKLAPIFLEEHELSRFADLFPVRFYAIRKCYKVLQGRDLLKTVAMKWDFFRERVRHELMEVRQDLRNGLLFGLPSAFMLTRSLKAILPRLLCILRVLAESPEGEQCAIEPFHSKLVETRTGMDSLPADEVEDCFMSIFASLDDLLASLETAPS